MSSVPSHVESDVITVGWITLQFPILRILLSPMTNLGNDNLRTTLLWHPTRVIFGWWLTSCLICSFHQLGVRIQTLHKVCRQFHHFRGQREYWHQMSTTWCRCQALSCPRPACLRQATWYQSPLSRKASLSNTPRWSKASQRWRWVVSPWQSVPGSVWPVHWKGHCRK